MRQKTLPPGAHWRMVAELNLGLAYQAAERWDDAEPLLLGVHEILLKRMPITSTPVPPSLVRLADSTAAREIPKRPPATGPSWETASRPLKKSRGLRAASSTPHRRREILDESVDSPAVLDANGTPNPANSEPHETSSRLLAGRTEGELGDPSENSSRISVTNRARWRCPQVAAQSPPTWAALPGWPSHCVLRTGRPLPELPIPLPFGAAWPLPGVKRRTRHLATQPPSRHTSSSLLRDETDRSNDREGACQRAKRNGGSAAWHWPLFFFTRRLSSETASTRLLVLAPYFCAPYFCAICGYV
jgi:hypothetical protein